MCFLIDLGQEKWNQRYVYKRVNRFDDAKTKWTSWWKEFPYEIGGEYKAGDRVIGTSGRAREGFYVYKTLARAIVALDGDTVLCLEVKNEDQLYIDQTGEISTYKKVRVVGEISISNEDIISATQILKRIYV